MSEERPNAPFITFYSFKGGIGRSMALINAAGILAGQRGFRVLVIDMDLEAPGLSYLDPEMPDRPDDEPTKPLPLVPGFVDLIADALDREQNADLFALSPQELQARYTRPVTLPPDLREFPEGTLHLMAAGTLDEGYSRRLNALDLRGLYSQGIGEPLIRAFKKTIAESGLYDYVLIDSRTGFSDEGGICTRDLADVLMILSGLNRQNIEGTSNFLRALRSSTDGKKKIQVILSPVPNGEDKLLDTREEVAKKSFKDAWGSELDLSLQIPYHPQLALTEEPHIFRRRKGHLFHAYRAIEERMLSSLGHTGAVLRKRVLQDLWIPDYGSALQSLNQMIRLEGGWIALSNLLSDLAWSYNLFWSSEARFTQSHPSIDKLVNDSEGKEVVEFFVRWIRVDDRGAAQARQLVKILRDRAGELANHLYCRMVEAYPEDVDLLGEYAAFLSDERQDLDGAEAYYRRALEAQPQDARNLRNYAIFLTDNRGDVDGAETYHKLALDAAPNDADTLGSYAVFLWQQLGDFEEAEIYFRLTLEADAVGPNHLVNYGQMLAAQGRFEEAQEKLRASLSSLGRDADSARAKALYALWLVKLAMGQDSENWERQYKDLIVKGFKRPRWTFDQILEQAAKSLSEEDLAYAKALAAAFLDENKVASLETLERWRKLEPPSPFATLFDHLRIGGSS